MSLQYKNLTSSERIRGQEVIAWILEDGDILDMVHGFHERGSRCAVVVWLEDGEVADAYISDLTALQAEFDMPRVLEPVSTYDTSSSVCIVVVREHRDAVLLVADTG